MNTKLLPRFFTALLLITILICSNIQQSEAQIFTVNNTEQSGNGSISWAVNTINALDTTGNIISFDRKITSITLAQELPINKSVTINGGGVTLIGSGHGRIFTITNGRAEFDSITFTKGYAVSDNGGAVKVEGTTASAKFTNCTFFNNHADNYGGAVCVTNGSLSPRTEFIHCTISGNLSTSGGGFAILTGRAEITASIITGNTVSYDVYTETDGAIIGDYNVIGTANTNLGTTNLTGQSANEVFFVNDSGKIDLQEVDGVNVLRLSGNSPARDIMSNSYGAEVDQTGAKRPMLIGYDAGAYEARPVPVQAIEIYGLPYIQVNDTDTLSITITPSDASLNTTEYPPDGIVWRSNNPGIISVDSSGNIRALGTGSSYITAAIYGWDSRGNKVTRPTASNALTIYAGTEPRRPKNLSIRKIEDITMTAGTYRILRPTVSMDINGINIENIKGGTDYTLDVDTARLDIVTADVVSGDRIRLLAMDTVGSCDITVRAYPQPDGTRAEETFTVSVTEGDGSTTSRDIGRSNGGGGCNSGISLLAGIFMFMLLGGVKRNA